MVQLNRKNLSDEFDLEYAESELENINSEIRGPGIPDQIILMNIARANRLLDRMESDIQDGNMSARMCEVASQLINSVTNASSQIMTDEYNKSYLQVRRNLVRLKEQEIKIRSRIAGTPRSRELIVTDRESILKFLDQESEKLVEEPKQIEE